MYELAKSSRDKMKAKARAFAGEKDQKVDSSDWTPASPLNADIKTGMRPVGKDREYKAGGAATKARADRKPRKSGGRAVEKEIGVGMANKNMKAANEQREGKKHIGGMKDGGGVYDKQALGKIDPRPKRGAAGHYKKGGRTKYEDGGYTGGKLPSPKEGIESEGAKVTEKPMSFSKAQKQSYDREEGYSAADRAAGRKKGGRTSKADGGIIDALANALAGRGYIDGSSWMDSSRDEAPAKNVGAPMQLPGGKRSAAPVHRRSKMEKISPERASREMAMAYENEAPGMRGSLAQPVQSDQFMKRGGKPKSREERKAGGRTRHGKGKTHINIMIAAGGRKEPGMPPAPTDGGPGGILPVPMPPAGGAMGAAMPPPPMPMPPAPPMGGGMPPMPPGRKAGGRITKVASSYKDMEAGAASGEGRLQKTDIAKKHHGAPARKTGGRAVKSFRDMTAGSESGKGRLQKTEIERSQRLRGH